jgi:pimeloyl-ACP methyl ester carboxylesterase
VVDFVRHPAARPPAREVLVETGGTTLSGLLAEPVDGGPPRALVVALHGLGFHAGYFDAPAAAGLSLLELGSRLGYTVWAPDRPGAGASADLPEDRLTPAAQVMLLQEAVTALAATRPVGAGVVLVGHSYGAQLALKMAAEPEGRGLLGVDTSGTGLEYAFDWDAVLRDGRMPVEDGDRGAAWGPEMLYPPGTIARDALPRDPDARAPIEMANRWSEELRDLGRRIRVPVRMTLGDHERWWRADPVAFEDLRAALSQSVRVSLEIEAGAGHNLSLGWAARSYHLKVLAFAEQCILLRRLSAEAG